jgi:hypothetical protein
MPYLYLDLCTIYSVNLNLPSLTIQAEAHPWPITRHSVHRHRHPVNLKPRNVPASRALGDALYVRTSDVKVLRPQPFPLDGPTYRVLLACVRDMPCIAIVWAIYQNSDLHPLLGPLCSSEDLDYLSDSRAR